jgi:hypothetical protein
LLGRDDLDVEAISKFSSVRANTEVISGRLNYEILIKTSGLMQVGWSTL